MSYNLSLKETAIAALIRESGRSLFFPELNDAEYAALVRQRNSDPRVQAFVDQVSRGMARELSPSEMRKSFSDLVKTPAFVHHSDDVRRAAQSAYALRAVM